MNTLTYALMLITIAILAALLDATWLKYGRPVMQRHFGWPPVKSDERIPTASFIGAAVFVGIIVAVAHIGAAAGF